MSVATAETVSGSAEPPSTTMQEKVDLPLELQMFAAALGLDPNAKNPLQRPDVDYLAVRKPPLHLHHP